MTIKRTNIVSSGNRGRHHTINFELKVMIIH